MAAMLRGNGFVIERAMGINYGGESVARRVFDPTELATKRGVFDDIENCYLLAYVCRKPHHPDAGDVAGAGLVERRWDAGHAAAGARAGPAHARPADARMRRRLPESPTG